MGALSIAVTGSVLCTGLVVRPLGHTTVGVHLRQVESTVETARQVRHVYVESELLILELEHLIVGIIGHKIDTRTDVLASNKLEGEAVAAGRDTVGGGVVGTIEGTLGSTVHTSITGRIE